MVSSISLVHPVLAHPWAARRGGRITLDPGANAPARVVSTCGGGAEADIGWADDWHIPSSTTSGCFSPGLVGPRCRPRP